MASVRQTVTFCGDYDYVGRGAWTAYGDYLVRSANVVQAIHNAALPPVGSVGRSIGYDDAYRHDYRLRLRRCRRMLRDMEIRILWAVERSEATGAANKCITTNLKKEPMSIATDIDAAITKRYSGFTVFRELAQLAHLFDRNFLDSVRTAIGKNKRPDESIQVKLGWIDKKPYADMTPYSVKDVNNKLITRPVELGDAAVFVFKAYVYDSKLIRRHGRGVIVQAKVAQSARLPSVPVTSLSGNPDNSTNKELALLSAWPSFDLHKLNDRRELLGSYQLNSLGSPPSYGWYAAAPSKNSRGWDKNGQWRSRWMCAPAKQGTACSSTLGELFEAIYLDNPLQGTNVGETCYPTSGPYQAKSSSLPQPTDWDKLCTQILAMQKKYEETSGPHGVFPSFPYIPGFGRLLSKSSFGHSLACAIWPDRFPVLTISSIVSEKTPSNRRR